ncbi:MAG: fructose-6-phosphate aldolase [Candidatus Sericytochromatia bacterium]|nr:fructose-6-phosphate aldolase [Candidatus Sericytochromatia bacterium]
MKLFIDSANIDEIKEVAGWGVVSGVTTNPSLIAKEGKDFKSTILQICRIIEGPVSAEVLSLRTEDMIKDGREYSSWHPNIVVKLPMSEQGIKATKILSNDGIKTNITLVFSANQALLAALAGATFISPFIGRIEDTGHEGMSIIEEIRTIFDHYVFDTQIITASIRSPQHVTMAAKIGSDISTIPHKILKQMFKHPLTESGIKQFSEDWQSLSSYKVPQGV